MTVARTKERRTVILRAAEKLFAAHGFHGTDVEGIAREAGTAKGTVYNYFENKDDIFLSVLEEGFRKLEGRMRMGLSKIKDPVEKIRKGIGIYIYFLADHLHLFRILAGEQMQFEDKIKKMKREEFFARVGHIERAISAGIKEGRLKKIDPFVASSSLFGMINFTVFRGLLIGKKFSAKRLSEQISGLYLEGMLP